MDWINRRRTQIIEKIEASDNAPLDESIQRELSIIETIQRDIQSIRAWPFDFSSLAKLVTIFISVTAILLSQIIGRLLGIGA